MPVNILGRDKFHHSGFLVFFKELLWHRALAQLVVIAVFSIWSCTSAFYLGRHVFFIDFLFSLHTSTWVIFIGCIAALHGRIGVMLWWVVLITTVLGGVWMVASVQLFVAQGRPLLWNEIIFRFQDEASRAFAISILMDFRLWSAIAGGVGLGLLLAAALKKMGLQVFVWVG